MLKSELFTDKFFGHKSGAFTGAQRQHKSSFEAAKDGTLFIDDVGEIPPANQIDFLHVLEERTFKHVDGERALLFHARIVAAINRLLPDMVARCRVPPPLPQARPASVPGDSLGHGRLSPARQCPGAAQPH